MDVEYLDESSEFTEAQFNLLLKKMRNKEYWDIFRPGLEKMERDIKRIGELMTGLEHRVIELEREKDKYYRMVLRVPQTCVYWTINQSGGRFVVDSEQEQRLEYNNIKLDSGNYFHSKVEAVEALIKIRKMFLTK